jgi:hypothetical protein
LNQYRIWSVSIQAQHRARRSIVPARAILIALLLSASPAFADCHEPEAGSDKAAMFSPPLSEVVVGKGRLQFYTAPNPDCAMKGIFVIPKDQLIAYAESDDGWSSVMYQNPKTGDHVSGWVKSSRLKQTGTVGPRQ